MKTTPHLESRRRLVTAIGAALLMTIAATTPVGAAAPALSAQQIVDKNVAARGGLAAWRAVQTMSMTGLLDAGKQNSDVRKQIEDAHGAPHQPHKRFHPAPAPAGDAQADAVIKLPYLIELKRPHKMRVELKVKDTTAVQVFDGTHGWKLRPYLGRHEVENYSDDELKLAQRQQELDGPLVDYAAKGTKIETAGVEPVDGHDAYKLKLTLKSGDVMYVWVDATSFLDVKLSLPRRLAGKQRYVATYLRDFRKVNGLMMPFLLEDQIEGSRGSQKIEIQQIAVNPPLDDKRFAKPE